MWKEETGGRRKRKWARKDLSQMKEVKRKFYGPQSQVPRGKTRDISLSGNVRPARAGHLGCLYRAECCSKSFSIGNGTEKPPAWTPYATLFGLSPSDFKRVASSPRDPCSRPLWFLIPHLRTGPFLTVPCQLLPP